MRLHVCTDTTKLHGAVGTWQATCLGGAGARNRGRSLFHTGSKHQYQKGSGLQSYISLVIAVEGKYLDLRS